MIRLNVIVLSSYYTGHSFDIHRPKVILAKYLLSQSAKWIALFTS